MIKNFKIGFIGAGNMATCLIQGMLENGYPTENIKIADIDKTLLKNQEQKFKVQSQTNIEIASNCDVIILAVKPQIIKAVCAEISQFLKDNTLIISIAAGVRIESIKKFLTKDIAIIRAMPNTPALIKQGATGVFANQKVNNQQQELVDELLKSLGLIKWLENENLLDVITALSGSGPAYLFLMMQSMSDVAQEMGLDKKTADLFSIQTTLGASQMALTSQDDLEILRQNVTSPNGTTFAALESFKKDNFDKIIKNAMTQAKQRAKTLGDELDE
ncbi:Pyrroline-5-carboxylate reductase [hydrothermal vent metagenome]|uniref:Pyrroline-5-carboxylate reductase n=1 Tax=hydrothermal vent metagenome TaxID=652676 RepID=A0A1W1CW56_9ZZZZ